MTTKVEVVYGPDLSTTCERPVFLERANLGDYSPTEVVLAANAHEALAVMSQPGFDFTHTTVIDESLPSGLVPASSGRLVVEPGKLRLSAKSRGMSVLVLPLEYSHCLDIEVVGGKSSQVRLLRTNLLQAGVLFSGQLEATLRYFTGPFHNAGCRIEDARDVERLDFSKEVRLPRVTTGA